MPVDPRIQAWLDAPLGNPAKRDDLFALTEPKKKGKRSYKARGYAGTPGAGPDGETCRSCKNRYVNTGYNKNFHKCSLSPRQGKSVAGDIALRSPACQRWEARS